MKIVMFQYQQTNSAVFQEAALARVQAQPAVAALNSLHILPRIIDQTSLESTIQYSNRKSSDYIIPGTWQ